MKNIKMYTNTENGKKAIEARLDELQKRCAARCITIKTITDRLERVERDLNIPKYKLAGVRVHYTGATKFPNAYKYRPESTHFKAIHNGKAWEVTDIYRDTCPNNQRCTIIELTEEAKNAIIENIRVTWY